MTILLKDAPCYMLLQELKPDIRRRRITVWYSDDQIPKNRNMTDILALFYDWLSSPHNMECDEHCQLEYMRTLSPERRHILLSGWLNTDIPGLYVDHPIAILMHCYKWLCGGVTKVIGESDGWYSSGPYSFGPFIFGLDSNIAWEAI